ncbi:serine/threonine-protein kinase [Pseudobacteriovorax antillogorgiicola]|uniref:Serine/threonine protein kinase n=1 Tax=Pseudobacteriovorax antillogorgiicola TaxID=1513793 RepID=A0A1Y6CR51_9BACT|nr:serine/threonine-protein kinase [Pseudobacteriovorax antillogorgiicola]TCS45919.1 serine/threonine protein kinase with TPR repeats [Pseudobacteriovorax antillogorgiicola]SMF71050.1 serine/threonine protein kinase [Pseudobacteriovorax antillogorgiicola]
MNKEAWQEIKDHFNHVLELPASERSAYLSLNCSNESIRNAVWQMLDSENSGESIEERVAQNALELASHQEHHSLTENQSLLARLVSKEDMDLLEKHAKGIGDFSSYHSSDEQNSISIGSKVGVYRIIRQLGFGGMGVVYLANRDDDNFDQYVALKLVRSSPGQKQIIRRFFDERKILAQLSSPYIAKLLDGGVTPSNHPYFTMEYIEGLSIDEYCKAKKLSVKEVVRLFMKVCQGISTAHRSLIIHRDIKPSNILVTADGEPKILDFGIAKILDSAADNHTTAASGKPMTLKYASPEQVSGAALTTATDIYSLGVMLYELLTGFSPYHEAHSKSSFALEKQIYEHFPNMPSRRVRRLEQSQQAQQAQQAQQKRRKLSQLLFMRKQSLARHLKGDLDNIVLMALRKEPHRRYQSVDHLHSDLSRYLENRTVLAHKDSLWYRSRKFAARNKVLSLATIVMVFFLAGFYQYDRHQLKQEIARNRQISEFLVQLFSFTDPYTDEFDHLKREQHTAATGITATQLLEKGVKSIQSDLAGQTVIQASLMHTLGSIYAKLGLYQESAKLINDSLGIRLKVFSRNSFEVAESLNYLGWIKQKTGQLQDAETLHLEALEIQQKLSWKDNPPIGSSYFYLGLLKIETGDYQVALDYLNQSLLHLPTEDDEKFQRYLNILKAKGVASEALDKYEGALNYFKKALAESVQHFDRNHPIVADQWNNIGSVLYRKGEYDQAIQYFEKALASDLKRLGKDHPSVASRWNNLANAWAEKGDSGKAIEYLEKALDSSMKTLGASHPRVANHWNNLGSAWHNQGEFDRALYYYEKALSSNLKTYGEDHPNVAVDWNNLGSAWYDKGEYEEAILCYKNALAISRKTLGNDHSDVAQRLNNLGTVWYQKGVYDKAIEFFAQAIKIYVKAIGPDHPRLLSSWHNLGSAWAKKGDWDKAIENHQKALALSQKQLGQNHKVTALVQRYLGKSFEEKHQLGIALNYYKDTFGIRLKVLGPDHELTEQSKKDVLRLEAKLSRN